MVVVDYGSAYIVNGIASMCVVCGFLKLALDLIPARINVLFWDHRHLYRHAGNSLAALVFLATLSLPVVLPRAF